MPVLGSEPVNLPFETSPKRRRRPSSCRAALATAARVADARNAQAICFEATAKLIDKQKNSEALARAKGGYQDADQVGKNIADELAQLKGAGQSFAGWAQTGERHRAELLALNEFNRKLGEHIKKLEDVVRRENDPTVAARQVQGEALAARITLLLGRGDVDEAINAYDQTRHARSENAEVKAQRDKLKAEWKPKNAAHAKARDYLLKTWPGIATIPDFRDSLPQIGSAVEECMKNGDRFTMRKLLSIFTGSIVKLKELTESLDQNSDSDRKLAADATRVGEAMAALESAQSASLWRGEK